jgi:hypothetical protein
MAESVDLSRLAEIEAAGQKKGPLALNEPVAPAATPGKGAK